MPSFRATNKLTNETSTYEASTPDAEHLSPDWQLEELVIALTPDGQEPAVDTRVYQGRRLLSKLEMIELLGDAAYEALLTMSKASVSIEAWIKKLELATPDEDGYSINLDDLRTQAGIQALGAVLEMQSVVTEGWAERVLNG
ncbi:MAG: hypothetical protein KGZ88_11845 [Methylomicrobium sp.]|nr:hypothetical protein [Methylomicrobium sp.]